MVQLCPRCQRANPKPAHFCWFDGFSLGQAPGPPPGQLLREFVFPSGRKCRTFDDLVQGCWYEWEDARTLLKDGTFAGFLAGLGRADLAKAAREAQFGDLDIGLTNFIAALPSQQSHGPKLGLNPRRLVVGPLRVGENKIVQVRVLNEGRGLLQGKITVADGASFLKIKDGDDETTCTLKTGKEHVLTLLVETRGLSVGQNTSGKLVAVTNGGVAEVPVRVDLTARPFAKAPYAGATTPQELARKMHNNPHPAVPLLESGDVASWFQSNGWSYPIVGAPAPGLAAVQQFFEELGLAKAPKVAVSDQALRFEATAPEVLPGQVTVRSAVKKLVYARVESDAPWLRVTTPGVSGQGQAVVDFEVDSSLMDESRPYVANLKIVANAGQTFYVRVQADVKSAKRGWFAPRAQPPAPGPVSQPPPRRTEARELPVAAVAADAPSRRAPAAQGLVAGALVFCLLRLFLVFPADLFARLRSAGPGAGTLEMWLTVPSPDGSFLRLFVLATWWLGAVLGGVASRRQGGGAADILMGVVAGAFAGLVAGATAGCLLIAGDAMPRAILAALLGGRAIGAGAATPLWIATAALSWLGIGAALGLLQWAAGETGRRWFKAAAAAPAWLLRLAGLPKMADFLVLRAG